MAESYTVATNNATGVEITGGRVGSFKLKGTDGLYIGASDVDSGDVLIGSGVVDLYVTSPDEIYVVNAVDPSGSVKIFHNR